MSVSSLIEEHATEKEREEGFDIADYLVRWKPSDFMKQPATVTVEEMTVNAEGKTSPSNPVVVSMVAKNPALSRLVEMFDCEVAQTEKGDSQASRMLTGDELKRLAAGLPDHDSFSEDELCRLLKIEPQHVRCLAESRAIYFIQLTARYCRNGCTPF